MYDSPYPSEGVISNEALSWLKEAEFDELVTSTLEDIQDLLIVKGKEYRRNNNPFHNFERGAEISGKTREEVLQGFLLKHLISVEDMRNDSKLGIHSSEEKIHEKYNDIIIYFLIEKNMMLENLKTYINQLESIKK